MQLAIEVPNPKKYESYRSSIGHPKKVPPALCLLSCMVWAWPLCLTCEAIRAGALATARPVASGASDASGVSVARRDVNLSEDSWTAGRLVGDFR